MTDRAESRASACEVIEPPRGSLTPSQASAIRLSTPDDVRLEIARLYRAARAGVMPVGDACKFAYILTELRRALETDLIDRRLKALEEHHGVT